MLTETLNHTTEDIEYLRHGDRAMMMRLFRPAGDGPFPVVADLHGGAWCKGDLGECQARDETFAEAGIAAAALDFRHAGDGYPTSLIDINYAIRWLKANAERLGLDADRVAITGQSSGGHLAMLAAMRPLDSRYASVALDAGAPAVDASVRCVGMTWPVINPLSRYRRACSLRDSDDTPAWVGDIPARHDLYWKTEEAMAEGNPMLALENGEAVETPPAIWVQGQPDPVHDYRDPESPLALNEPERFAANYRNAGGEIEVVYFDQAQRDTSVPTEPLVAFFRRQLT
ncbi:MAG: alpha/beta fold hydrolase [Alphaproteobacteria bacterium]|nr:alpha/beta fold hydrolase [Alphaproteobacteria bacterium]